MKLAPGEIFISELDLNIERGVIEEPFHPMLRFVQVVPDRQGRSAGFLILNHSAQDILNALKNPRDEEDISTIQLVDTHGNYLIAPTPDQEWGWLRGKPELTIANLHPETWHHIKEHETQVFEIEDHVLIYLAIDPSQDLSRPIFVRSPNETLRFNFEFPVFQATEWILIDLIERDELNSGAMLNQTFIWLFIVAIYAIILLLSYAVSYFYGRQEYARAKLLEESQRREKQLDGFIEAAPDGIVVSNVAGEIQRVNSRLEDMLGYRRHELIGQSIDMLVPQHLRAEFASKRTNLKTTRSDQNKEIGLDFSAQKKDGSLRPVDIALGKLTRDGSALIISSMRDISNLKEAERQLKLATVEAEKANQSKSIFLANMSHEIRTPLNAVLGNTYLLQKSQQLNDTASTQVARILRAGKALLAIINDILDLSKIEAGELQLEQRPLRLPSLLLDVEAIGRSQADPKGIDFIVEDLPSDLCPDVVTDDVRLRQILLNLVSNAVKFTLTGQVRISVERAPVLDPSSTNTQWATFHIHDTGIGIADEQKDHLFEPFKQADSSTTRIFGGSGLGLTIVQELCVAMGGSVSFESQLGKGSRFSATLPLTLASEEDMEGVGLQVRPLEILVCEDDPQAGEQLREICASLGWRAEICSAGPGLGKRLLQRHEAGLPTDCLILEGRTNGNCNFERLAKLVDTIGAENAAPALFLRNPLAKNEADAIPPVDALSVPWAVADLPIDLASLFNKVSELRVAHGTPQASLLSRTRMDQPEMQWLAGAKFLVVDDSNANRDVASSILKNQGAQVFGCTNGAEALDWLRDERHAVDLVLMDIQMPVMDGNQAVTELRKIDRLRDLPVIALTAGALADEKDRALSAGMTDYMTKPFDPERMVRLLRQQLEARNGSVLPAQVRPAGPQTFDGGAFDDGHPWPSLPDLDETLAKQRLSGDLELFLQLLDSLTEEFSDLETPWPLPASVDEAKALAARAHKLAGNASLVGATRLFDLAKEIELGLTQSAGHPDLPDLSRLNAPLEQLSQLYLCLAAAVIELPTDLRQLESAHNEHNAEGEDPGQAVTGALDADPLEALREALVLRKISALDLLKALEPDLRPRLGESRWDQITATSAKLDFQGVLAVLDTLDDQDATAELVS